MNGPALRRAAIDIGTVSTRLLVADVSGEGKISEILRRTLVTHLGENLTSTGRLSNEAMTRVVDVVEGFLRDCARLGAEDIFAIATSAARDAANGEALLHKLEQLGARPEIVSGSREALLSFTGATYELDDEDILVADLGGGSTELILGTVEGAGESRGVDVDAARSIDVGSRRVTEMFLHSDPPARDEMDEAEGWVAEEMRPFFDGLRERPRSLIALAGTATALSAIKQGLETYDSSLVHGTKLSGGDLSNLKEDLASVALEDRLRIPGLDPGRAPVIVAGALILETVLGLAGLDSVTVSEHDILYGMVLSKA